MVPPAGLRGLVLLLGVVVVVLAVLMIFSVVPEGGAPFAFALALLGIGLTVQALDGRTP